MSSPVTETATATVEAAAAPLTSSAPETPIPSEFTFKKGESGSEIKIQYTSVKYVSENNYVLKFKIGEEKHKVHYENGAYSLSKSGDKITVEKTSDNEYKINGATVKFIS